MHLIIQHEDLIRSGQFKIEDEDEKRLKFADLQIIYGINKCQEQSRAEITLTKHFAETP